MKNVFCGLLVGLCLCASQVRADFSVTGTGKVTVKPDFAVVQLSVINDAATAQEAGKANKLDAVLLIKSLSDLKIADKDIQTCGFTVTPKYKYIKDEYILSGYQAVHSYKVVVRDLSSVGKVLDLSGAANRVVGVTWDVENRSEISDKARKLAVEDAKRKVDLYATSTGVTLDKVKSLNEELVERGIYSSRAFGASAPEGVPSAPGEVEISVRINVVYGVK